MSKFYLYNDVKLPALPEWDKTRYPYAFIYIVTLDGTTGVYTLVVTSSNVMSYDGNGIICTAANVGQRYTVSGEEWAAAAGSDDFYIKRDNLIFTVWANFDVLNADGSVYVVASEPVAVAGKFPLREWVGWLLAGLCSRPLPVSVRNKVPVAYLYNGVRLPDINASWELISTEFGVTVEVAKSIIPYATVISNSGEYRLFLFTKLPYVDGNDCKVPNEVSIFVLDVNGNAWVFTGSQNYDYGFDVVLGEKEVLVWTNTDILDTGGSVYLATSDPVPVYE